MTYERFNFTNSIPKSFNHGISEETTSVFYYFGRIFRLSVNNLDMTHFNWIWFGSGTMAAWDIWSNFILRRPSCLIFFNSVCQKRFTLLWGVSTTSWVLWRPHYLSSEYRNTVPELSLQVDFFDHLLCMCDFFPLFCMNWNEMKMKIRFTLIKDNNLKIVESFTK